MVPYPDFLVKNEIDYNTRIYRLVLDSTKTYVQKIACTGASFPISAPWGNAFNFEADKPLNISNNEITIQFKSVGSRYMDDIIVSDFNKTVRIFNPMMRPEYIDTVMVKIPMEELQIFSDKGYPRIDPDTKELQWWVPTDDYNNSISSYNRHASALKG